MIHVVAQIEIKDGKQQAFLDEFRKLVPVVLQEEGCIDYGPTVDAETDIDRQHTDDTVITIIERWESLDDLKAHLVAPHMATYRERVKDYVARATLKILRPA